MYIIVVGQSKKMQIFDITGKLIKDLPSEEIYYDYSIDNEFGTLESLNQKGESILSQIEKGYSKNIRYYVSLAGEAVDKMSPETIDNLNLDNSQLNDQKSLSAIS